MKKLRKKAVPVEVWWDDSHGAVKWLSSEEFLDAVREPMTVRSLGYLQYESKDRIALTMSLHNSNRMHSLVIPRTQIRRIVRFKLK